MSATANVRIEVSTVVPKSDYWISDVERDSGA